MPHCKELAGLQMKTYIIVAKREKNKCSQTRVIEVSKVLRQMIFRADATKWLLLLLANPRWLTCCMLSTCFIKRLVIASNKSAPRPDPSSLIPRLSLALNQDPVSLFISLTPVLTSQS